MAVLTLARDAVAEPTRPFTRSEGTTATSHDQLKGHDDGSASSATMENEPDHASDFISTDGEDENNDTETKTGSWYIVLSISF